MFKFGICDGYWFVRDFFIGFFYVVIVDINIIIVIVSIMFDFIVIYIVIGLFWKLVYYEEFVFFSDVFCWNFIVL